MWITRDSTGGDEDGVVAEEREERKESYQCLWSVKIGGLASYWTLTMKVLGWSFVEEEEEKENKERNKRRKTAIEEKERRGMVVWFVTDEL